MSEGPRTPAERGAASPPLALLLPVCCALVLLYAVWSGLHLGGEPLNSLVTYLVELAATVATLVVAGVRARAPADRSTRIGWTLVSLSYAGFTVGDGTDAFYAVVLHTQPPFPSLADLGIGFGIAVILPGIFFLGGRMLSSSRLRVFLDGALISGALLAVSQLTVLRAIYEASGDHSWLFALGLAYPISDVVLTVVAISVLSRSRQLNPALLMVTLGIVAGAFGDSAFAFLSALGVSRTSFIVETGYFAASVFISAGSLIGRASRPVAASASLSRWQVALPYLPLAVACALVAVDLVTQRAVDLPTELIVVAVIALVLARQFMAVSESQSLTSRVNRLAAEREVLVEEAPVGICHLDRDGRLVAANHSFLRMLGCRREEVLGEPFVGFLAQDDRPSAAAAYQALADGQVNHFDREGRFVRRDGTFTWCSLVASVVRDAGGRAESFISIVEDISAHREQAERAAQIQRRLLPGSPPELAGYELAGVCLPAQDVAGDFYDWSFRDGHLDLTVADVMGKGVGAALVMAVLRTALRSCPDAAGPAARVRTAAESLSLGDGMFVTLFYARLDTGSGLLQYVDAGHGYCAICRAGGELVHLSARSLPLGVLDNEVFREGTARLDPGDTLVLYSDGLVEREDGTIELRHLVEGLGESPGAADSVKWLLTSMPGRPTDDVTVVVLRRAPDVPVAGPLAAATTTEPAP